MEDIYFIETDKQNKFDNTIPNDISYLNLRCSILTENQLAFDNVFKSTRSKAGDRSAFCMSGGSFNNCPNCHHLPVIVIRLCVVSIS